MTNAISSDASRPRSSAWLWLLARAGIAIVVALIVTLNSDHTTVFTTVTFGVWAVLTAVTHAGWALTAPTDTLGRFYGGVLATLALLAGAASFFWTTLTDQRIGALIVLWALVAGVIEGLSGLRLEAGAPSRSDQIISGVLGVLLGIAQFGSGESVWTAGLFGLYLALIGVHLVIAAVSLRRPARGETKRN